MRRGVVVPWMRLRRVQKYPRPIVLLRVGELALQAAAALVDPRSP